MTNLIRYFPDWPREGTVTDVVEIMRLSAEVNPALSLAGCQPRQISIAWEAFSESMSASWMNVDRERVAEFMAWLKKEHRAAPDA